MENIIEIKNLSFKYNTTKAIFGDLNLTIKKGEITTLLGKNGCGKSTLIKLLSKNITNYTGNIFLENKELKSYSLKELATKLSIVYQNNITPQEITVFDMVSFARLPYQNIFFYKQTKEDIEKINFALKETDLIDYKNTIVSELSGGQLQRISILRALSPQTKVLIADEITASLDAITQAQLWSVILEEVDKHNMTLVLITHNRHLANRVCEELVEMNVINN